MTAIPREAIREETLLHFHGDAAECHLPPGRAPARIEVEPPIGNGQPFLMTGENPACATYVQGNGMILLTIWKD